MQKKRQRMKHLRRRFFFVNRFSGTIRLYK